MKGRLFIVNIKYPIKTLGVEINNYCQLNCSYCWTKQQIGSNLAHELEYKHIQNALNIVYKSQKNHLDNTCMVVFCAKEPLLSWELIKKLWEKNKKNNLKYNVRFHILSNGVALNEDIINYCIKERIMISISLDGKNSHDLYRKFYSNEPSYEYIKNNLKLIPKQLEAVLFNIMLTINKDNIQDLENNIWDILTIHPSMQISLGTNNSEFTEYDWEELKNKFIPFYLNLPSFLQKRINIKKFFFEEDKYSNNGTFSLYLENDGRLHIAYPLATTIIRPLNQLDGYVFNSYINNNVLKIYQEQYEGKRLKFYSKQCQNNCSAHALCYGNDNILNRFEIDNRECNAIKNWHIIWRKINDY